MNIEYEIKLILNDQGAADALVRALDIGQPLVEDVRLQAVYFDTPAQDLARSGCSLRIRKEGRKRIQTVKMTGGTGAGGFARREWERTVRGAKPVLDENNPVKALLGARVDELQPRFEIVTLRSLWMIESHGTAVEMSLDRAEARAGDATEKFSEIELELKQGDEAELFALARRIGRLAPVRLGMISKAERAQRLLKKPGSSDKAGVVPLDPDMTTVDALRTIVHACLRHYRLNETRLSGGDDNAPALHQARVALRRMRSALVAFRPIVKGKEARRLNAELRWLAGQMGRARNIDVLIPRMRDRRAQLALKAARGPAYADARRAMDSALARELMLDLAEWAATGEWSRRKKTHKYREEPARDYAARAIARQHDVLRADADAITGPDDERRHEARKTAKKLRYTVEFFALLFDKGKERKARIRYLAALEELQDHLGAINDLAVIPAMLAELGLDPGQAGMAEVDQGVRDFHILQAGHAMTLVREAKPFWE